jgi:N-acetylmuramoyl-L-alanine amidase
MRSLRGTAAATSALLALLLAALLQAQGTAPPTPLTLIARDARRPVPTTLLSGQELIALDDVATLFQVAVREDTLTGGITITYRGRTIVASPDQPMASVNGRVVTLPSPIVRSGRRWMVPVEFLPRALGPIYDQRIDLRRQSRLLIVGDLRVPRITARIDATGPPTRATVEIAPPVPVSTAVENGRVLLRIDADALDVGVPGAASGLIEQIRAGDQLNTIAVQLAPAATTARATVNTADPAVTRVGIEVAQATAPPQDATATPPRPAAPAGEGAPPVLARAGVQTIAIDPGHGGDEIGARGSAGTEEKQLTLDVARRLRGLVETRLGLHVVLTRDDDRTVPLDQRTATANNNKADLFVSLHANAALSPRASGAEVYHLRLGREEEQVRREAEAGSLTLPVLGGGNRTIDLVRWDLAQARHVEGSATFASMLGDALKDRVPMGPRPHQQAPLRVLEGADMPAALVEMAYLTNPDQEKLAGSDEFKNSIAQAIYDAIVRLRGGGGGGAEQAP